MKQMIPLVTTKVKTVFPVFEMFVNSVKVVSLYALESVFAFCFSTLQIMVNVMHARPRYDFSADYFVKIYRAECVNLRLHCNLIKSILDKQVGKKFCVLHMKRQESVLLECPVTCTVLLSWLSETTVRYISFRRSRSHYKTE